MNRGSHVAVVVPKRLWVSSVPPPGGVHLDRLLAVASAPEPTVTSAASQNETLEVNTFGSDYATSLTVVSTDLTACGDDKVRFDAEAGMTYLLMVGSFNSGPGGQLVFNLFAPVLRLPTLSASLDRLGVLDANAIPTLSGSFSCSGADGVGISAEVTQSVGRRRGGEGQGLVFVPCTASDRWAMPIDLFSTTFFPGPADVFFRASACDSDGCVNVYLNATVYLHP